jgi:hypothetical protein
MFSNSYIDRMLSGVGLATCLGALALRWQHNTISGSRSGMDLLRRYLRDGGRRSATLHLPFSPARDHRWLMLFLVSVAVATVATFARRRLVAICAMVCAGTFLLLVRYVILGNTVRQFGEDSTGQFFETAAASSVGVGYYVAVGALLVVMSTALFSSKIECKSTTRVAVVEAEFSQP